MVSVGNDIYNLTKNDNIQIIDITEFKFPNIGGYLSQNWVIKCNDINNNGELQFIIRSTKTSSGTAYSRAAALPPIGNGFMYGETSSGNHGHG